MYTYLQKVWGGAAKTYLEKTTVFWKKGAEIWEIDGTSVSQTCNLALHMMELLQLYYLRNAQPFLVPSHA